MKLCGMHLCIAVALLAPLVVAQWQKGRAVTVYPLELAMAEPLWPKP